MNDRMWAHGQTHTTSRICANSATACSIRTPASSPSARDTARDACRSRISSSRTSAASSKAGRPRREACGGLGRPDARGHRPGAIPVESQQREDGRRHRRRRMAARRRRDAGRGSAGVPAPAGADDCAGSKHGARCAMRSRADLARADVLVMAAAPADFRLAVSRRCENQKVTSAPAADAPRRPRPTSSSRPGRRTTPADGGGFALETDDGLATRAPSSAQGSRPDRGERRRRAGAGFEVDTNRVTFVDRDGARQAICRCWRRTRWPTPSSTASRRCCGGR